MQPYKAFIIRLKENKHSNYIAEACVDQAKKFNIDVEYFDAINGNDVEEHYKKTRVPRPSKALKKGKLGVLGCFFSHYYLWRKCMEDKQQIPYLILEHDGYIIKPITENLLNGFDDVLKLDRCDPYSNNYNNTIELEKNKIVTVEKYINPTPKAVHKIGTGNYFKGAYAYILKPQGAKKLIRFIHQNKNLKGHRPADQQIGDKVLNTWTTVPSIARLHPFYSEGNNLKTASLTGNPELL